MSIFVVTQTFHHDGRDVEQHEVIGYYSAEFVAEAVALIETRRWENIAYAAEVEEFDGPDPAMDEDDLEALIDWLAEHQPIEDDALASALDIIVPDWSERLSALQTA